MYLLLSPFLLSFFITVYRSYLSPFLLPSLSFLPSVHVLLAMSLADDILFFLLLPPHSLP